MMLAPMTFRGVVDHAKLRNELASAIGETGWYITGSVDEVTFTPTREDVQNPTQYIEAHIANSDKSAKAAIWSKIKSQRDRRMLDSGVLVDGHWFYSDLEFREVLTQGLRILPLADLPDDDPRKLAAAPYLDELREVRWKTMDGEFVVPELILATKIDCALAVLGKRCHFNGERLKQIVYASDTPEKVELRNGWPDAYYDVSH